MGTVILVCRKVALARGSIGSIGGIGGQLQEFGIVWYRIHSLESYGTELTMCQVHDHEVFLLAGV